MKYVCIVISDEHVVAFFGLLHNGIATEVKAVFAALFASLSRVIPSHARIEEAIFSKDRKPHIQLASIRAEHIFQFGDAIELMLI